MNVLHIYRTCMPETNGGIEQVIKYLSKGISQGSNDESKILSLSNEKKSIEYDGVSIEFFKRNFSIASNCFSLSLLLNASEFIKWADIVHLHYPWPSGDLCLLLCQNKKVVLTYHSDIERQSFFKYVYRPFELMMLKRVDRVIATSENYVKSSLNLKKLGSKVEVVPLGVNEDDYYYSEEELAQCRNEFGEDFFLFVGVLRYYKGLEYLIQAADGFKGTIVIAGKGPELLNLQGLVSELGLTNVKFAGFVSDERKCALFKLSKAFVFPSHLRSEAFGVSLVEGLMFGKPLISCDIKTGTSFVNENGKTGFVIESANPDALRASMSRLLDDDICSIFSKNSRSRYLELFTSEKMTSGYNKIYQKILAEDEKKNQL